MSFKWLNLSELYSLMTYFQLKGNKLFFKKKKQLILLSVRASDERSSFLTSAEHSQLEKCVKKCEYNI